MHSSHAKDIKKAAKLLKLLHFVNKMAKCSHFARSGPQTYTATGALMAGCGS